VQIAALGEVISPRPPAGRSRLAFASVVVISRAERDCREVASISR